MAVARGFDGSGGRLNAPAVKSGIPSRRKKFATGYGK
jgi:hypothetical protein